MQAMPSSSCRADGRTCAAGRADGSSPAYARPTTVLIGHGTRDAEGAQEALHVAARLADRLASRTGPVGPVVPCFLELTDPPILPTIARCVDAGAEEIVALPLMLFGANHVKSDIPAALAVARARHPSLTIRYGAPLGVQPEMLDVIDDRISAVEAATPPFPRADTAILLVERGSSDPDANAQVYQLGRMLWEGRGFGWVEPCFIGITRPSLEEGLARCLALGARRVLVLPYFLFTGVLVRRISRIVADVAASHPAIDFRVAEHLGCHPRLLDLVVRRIEEAHRGAVSMSCDRCKWRVPLAGYADQVGRLQTSDAAHGLRDAGTASHHHAHGPGHHHPHH
jgi:sirohydrochlorin cobaltochelatase